MRGLGPALGLPSLLAPEIDAGSGARLSRRVVLQGTIGIAGLVDAFNRALREADIVLLEPILRLQVTMPVDNLGDIVG